MAIAYLVGIVISKKLNKILTGQEILTGQTTIDLCKRFFPRS